MIDASLRVIGLDEDAARVKAGLFRRARERLSTPPDAAFWVPGRVEFMGKHTDYAGGRSLLCAVDRGLCVLVSARTDARLRIVDALRPDEVVDATIDRDVRATDGHWSTYALTVARRVARDFGGNLRGVEIAFASDLPVAAGMSSSSALVVATFLALADVNSLTVAADRLPGYLGAVESGSAVDDLAADSGVGTFGGSEDHTAILCARPNALVQYSFSPVRFERDVPLPNDHVLVIASSGIVAEKIGAARERYNALSVAAQLIAARWRSTTGRDDATLGDIVSSSPNAIDRLMLELDEPLRRRLAHFVLESTELIPAAADALQRGDLIRLGAVVDKSQEGAEQLLRNQVPETSWLAREARVLGAVAASAFGAGFGGSVWALVRGDDAVAFRAAWSERYARHFPVAANTAMFFITRAGPPAAKLSDGEAVST